MQDLDTADDFIQVPVGVLKVINEDMPPQTNSVAIILEGNTVMDKISTTSQALCLLFGLMYALHLDNIVEPRTTANIKNCSFELDVEIRDS